MLRPVLVDVFDSLWPFALGILAFWAGRFCYRGPSWLRHGLVSVGVIGIGAASLIRWLPANSTFVLSLAGGASVLLCWIAALLLGIVWSVPRRSLSNGFLACLLGIAGFVLLVESEAGSGGAFLPRICGKRPPMQKDTSSNPAA